MVGKFQVTPGKYLFLDMSSSAILERSAVSPNDLLNMSLSGCFFFGAAIRPRMPQTGRGLISLTKSDAKLKGIEIRMFKKWLRHDAYDDYLFVTFDILPKRF